MGTEHLNDKLGQEASDYIEHNKKIEEAVMAMLNSAVGGYCGPYKQTRKERLLEHKHNGKRTDNSD